MSGELWRRLVLPKRVDRVQQRLVKTGGRLVKHARCYWLLLAEDQSAPASVQGDAAADLGAAGADGLTRDERHVLAKKGHKLAELSANTSDPWSSGDVPMTVEI